MFDRDFYRFAVGFSLIILFGMGTLFIAGYFKDDIGSQTASPLP